MKDYEEIAEKWLKEHYPKKELNKYGIDVRYSAVLNFSRYIDRKENEN